MMWLEKQLGRLVGLLAVVGSLAILLLLGITVVGVFWRYGLNDPIFGIEDVSTMALTVVVAAAVAFGARHRAHVGVNVITMVAGRSVTRWTDLLARILGTGMLAFATYALFKKGQCGFACGAMTNNLAIVHTPFYMMLSLAMGSFAVLMLLHLLIGLKHWHDEDPNEVKD